MTSETRTFSGVGSFSISYGYNLGGELTSITDPFSAQVGYSHDQVGRLSSVTGSGFANVSTYASNLQYRASGVMRYLNYGNNLTLDVSFNARLQPTSFEIPGVMTKTYEYYNDGTLKYSQDLPDPRFDRSYTYDHAARLTGAFSGAEARGEPPTTNRPYKQTYGFDGFSHMTSRVSNHWTQGEASTNIYSNNRRSGWSYDADGNLLASSDTTYGYDAAGRITTLGPDILVDQKFDGDGGRIKTAESVYNESTNQWEATTTTYYLRSSVLGGKVLTELSPTGAKQRTFVYVGSQVLASQGVGYNNYQQVFWEHRDPSNLSVRNTSNTYYSNLGSELDPAGSNAGTYNPYLNPFDPPEEGGGFSQYPGFGELSNLLGRCRLDGMPWDCSDLHDRMDAGAALVESPHVWVKPKDTEGDDRPDRRIPHQGRVESYGIGLFALEMARHGSDAGGVHIIGLYFNPQKTIYSPEQIRNAVGVCTKALFKVSLVDFTGSTRGHNGVFNGKNLQIANPANQGISIVNEVNAYSGAKLARFHERVNGLKRGSVKRLEGVSIDFRDINGRLTGFSPYRNFTANDVRPGSSTLAGVDAVLDTQIWELGNSLSTITKIDLPGAIANPGGGSESAPVFEDCVRKQLGGGK